MPTSYHHLSSAERAVGAACANPYWLRIRRCTSTCMIVWCIHEVQCPRYAGDPVGGLLPEQRLSAMALGVA